jgi:hypothetical protein
VVVEEVFAGTKTGMKLIEKLGNKKYKFNHVSKYNL